MVKKIPFVGGKVTYALIIAGLLALLMGGVFNPLQWVLAWIDGIDKLAWIMALNIFGSIYAASQTEMKTLDLVLNVARVSLGSSPKGLIVAIILVLGLAGSLLGDSVASATVVGILVIGILSDMQISAAGIGCIIMMGASLGSIMPPITQAVFLASSLAQVDTTPVVNISYITVGIGFVICTIYAVFAFVKIKALPEHLIPSKTAGQIMHGNWHLMLPLAVLILLVILQTAAGINLVQMATGPLMGWPQQHHHPQGSEQQHRHLPDHRHPGLPLLQAGAQEPAQGGQKRRGGRTARRQGGTGRRPAPGRLLCRRPD